jgi:uncharacterized membrane protein
LILQGAGVGILYLTVFASARLYHVLPLGLTLALLLVLVALSAMLAVLQDSRALATIATAGGFLAPVLTSTGSGNHVALFSYYAVLNLGIVGIAWFKAWRILNWIGFMFTFVIGAAWGYRYYRPEHFATTEPFLILSFLFYLAISVLFAHRHPPKLRGYVDGTLVFGLPLVCFALQAPLVRDIEFGRAWTALGMGAIYLAVARWLWHRHIEHMRMLIESLLALGVVALSLAIPFALDGHFTAAAWALEGTGLIWIGVRQQRVLARQFGTLLQLCAGIGFFAIHANAGHIAVLNTNFLGCVFIALGGVLASYLLYRAQRSLHEWERYHYVLLLVWGLMWWFGAGLHEIERFVAPPLRISASLLFGASSVAALSLIAHRLRWQPGLLATLPWLPLLALVLFGLFIDSRDAGPLADWRWLGWIAALGAGFLLLRRGESVFPALILRSGHALAWWLCLFLACWGVEWSVASAMPHSAAWSFAVWGVLPALAITAMPIVAARLYWPAHRFADVYLVIAQLPVAMLILAWVLVACVREGDPYPLAYIPLLNPLELAQALCLIAVLRWWHAIDGASSTPHELRAFGHAPSLIIGAVAFLWLNAATARAVHFMGGVAWTGWSLHHSPVFQGAISVLWGVTALAVMLGATRIRIRPLWLGGAALLAALVAKLFFIDLSGSGTVARIVSFMAAGGLMVLIGYISPAPPRGALESKS